MIIKGEIIGGKCRNSYVILEPGDTPEKVLDFAEKQGVTFKLGICECVRLFFPKAWYPVTFMKEAVIEELFELNGILPAPSAHEPLGDST